MTKGHFDNNIIVRNIFLVIVNPTDICILKTLYEQYELLFFNCKLATLAFVRQ